MTEEYTKFNLTIREHEFIPDGFLCPCCKKYEELYNNIEHELDRGLPLCCWCQGILDFIIEGNEEGLERYYDKDDVQAVREWLEEISQ